MAYLAIHGHFPDPLTLPPQFAPMAPETPAEENRPAAEAATARLSPLEWAVVALARKDSPRSLREPGRLSMALGRLFGTEPSRRLADPKLEALRRAAVLAWRHGYTIPTHEFKAFLAAGFTSDQYELMQASISQAKAHAMARNTRRLAA